MSTLPRHRLYLGAAVIEGITHIVFLITSYLLLRLAFDALESQIECWHDRGGGV